MSEAKEPLVVLARLGRPHGVRGALSVSQAGAHLSHWVGQKLRVCKPLGEAAGTLTDYTTKGDFTLGRTEPAKGEITRVQFAEIQDRDAAAALTNFYLGAPLAELRALVSKERGGKVPALTDLWYFELLGLAVIDAATQTQLGQIAAVEDLGLNTTVIIEPAAGKSLLAAPLEIPLEYPHWQELDLAQNRVSLAEWHLFAET
jgi:ribosomal 30S subunit maturation factor RimM